MFPALSASWRIERGGLHAERPALLQARAPRGLGHAGQPGACAVRNAAAAQGRPRRASIRSAAAVTTGLRAAQVANPDLKWETVGRRRTSASTTASRTTGSPASSTSTRRTRRTCSSTCRCRSRPVSTRPRTSAGLKNTGSRSTLDGRALRRARTVAHRRGSSSRRAQQGHRPRRGAHVHRHGRRQRPGPVGPASAAHHPRPADRHVLGPEVRRRERAGPAGVRLQVGSAELRRTARRRRRRATTRRIIGNANPNFTLGLHSNGDWGSFDASLLWRGEFGERRVQQHGARLRDEGQRDAGPELPEVGAERSDRHQRAGDLLVALDRERLVRPPAERHGRLHVRRCRLGGGSARTRVYVSGDNLLLFTRYNGYDPGGVHVSIAASRRAASTT